MRHFCAQKCQDMKYFAGVPAGWSEVQQRLIMDMYSATKIKRLSAVSLLMEAINFCPSCSEFLNQKGLRVHFHSPDGTLQPSLSSGNAELGTRNLQCWVISSRGPEEAKITR